MVRNTTMVGIVGQMVIVDIDGTLANNKHRVHHLEKTPKDWRAFDAALSLDTPYKAIVDLIAALSFAYYEIVLVTSRRECDRAETQAWLAKHFVYYDRLYMRMTNDRRPDAEVKREVLDEYLHKELVAFVIEDRNSVVKMWRDAGLVCLQCAEGDF